MTISQQMKWDYTDLAQAYLKRPDYSEEAIDKMLALCSLAQDAKICDVGAGVGHLSIMLASRGYHINAVEPNDAMRALGEEQSAALKNISWYKGTAEDTGQEDDTFSLVTFGSSFNVVDRPKALDEVHRITKPNAWFACMWNHRDIADPLQNMIEEIIASHIEGYQYGLRREDQSAFLKESGFFDHVDFIEKTVMHQQSIDDCIEAWRSHATLQRQAGEKFSAIVDDIASCLRSKTKGDISIPYETRLWVARFVK